MVSSKQENRGCNNWHSIRKLKLFHKNSARWLKTLSKKKIETFNKLYFKAEPTCKLDANFSRNVPLHVFSRNQHFLSYFSKTAAPAETLSLCARARRPPLFSRVHHWSWNIYPNCRLYSSFFQTHKTIALEESKWPESCEYKAPHKSIRARL